MSTITIPEILIPAKNVDMTKWSVVACDQFTAKLSYWSKVESLVGDSPSTLRLIFPEAYLLQGKAPDITKIQGTMENYLASGVFQTLKGLILVERTLSSCKRFGLMVAIDLEDYDFRRIRKPIRSTEDTILSRLPARVEIRRGASLELPHAMLLVDDREKSIIEPIIAKREKLQKLYDFDLNMNGGNIKGYLVDEPQSVAQRIEDMLSPALQVSKYGTDAGIMLAVGDGNHSIASAKVYWDELKTSLSPDERTSHPARFALAELVNIYGEGMDFEPIHRVVYDAGEGFIKGLEDRLTSLGSGGSIELLTRNGRHKISTASDAAMTIAGVQSFIEEELKKSPIKVDYVHGESHLADVVNGSENALGILMPKFPAGSLFNYVVNVGNLPKKAFSIGEPNEKRYYLEAKYIR